jgi:hypothetical protein
MKEGEHLGHVGLYADDNTEEFKNMRHEFGLN